MFWVVPVVLLALWLHGLLMGYTVGTAIQILFALAIIVVVGRVILGRRAR